MKLVTALFFLITLSYFGQTKKPSTYYTVSGSVNLTGSYCGGAAPSEEILEGIRKPSPYIGKVFYVRKGKTNDLKQPIVLKFKTDSLGKFSFKLPVGVYCIIQEEQKASFSKINYPKTGNISVDKTCLLDWWKKPYSILEIKDKSITELEFKFEKRCFIPGDVPCLTFNGPFPP
jgi:hypothetical protein